MKNRTIHRWQWAYVTSRGETIVIGAEQVPGYRRLQAKRAAAGKPIGALWRRRVSYGPWRAAS